MPTRLVRDTRADPPRAGQTLAGQVIRTQPLQRRVITTTIWRHARNLPAFIIAALAAGCGGSPGPTNLAVSGPHGVPAVAIPGGFGFAEARFEAAPAATPGQSDKPAKRPRPTQDTASPLPFSGAVSADVRKGSSARIVVYFLEPDGKTPLAVLPEKVQAIIGMPGTYPNKYTKAYELTNEPRDESPVARARFASIPFQLPEQRITGRVTAVLRGQDVSFPLVLSGPPTN